MLNREDELKLEEGLQALRSVSLAPAGGDGEARLRAAYRAAFEAPRRSWDWPAWAAAAAAAAMIAMAPWLWRRAHASPPTHRPGAVQARLARPMTPKQLKPVRHGSSPVKRESRKGFPASPFCCAVVPPSQQVLAENSGAPPAVQTAASGSDHGWIPLPDADPAQPLEGGVVLRVEIPASSLEPAGAAAVPGSPDNRVMIPAQLLVDQDNGVRAIRFISH